MSDEVRDHVEEQVDLKERLFKPRLGEQEIEVEGVGTLRIRSLTRSEAHSLDVAKDAQAKERRILRLGLVEPSLTDQDIRRWSDSATAGEIQDIVIAITRLSGMDKTSKEKAKEADKEAYATFPDDADS